MEEALVNINKRLDALATRSDIDSLKIEVQHLTETFIERFEKLEGRLLETEARNDGMEKEIRDLREEKGKLRNAINAQERRIAMQKDQNNFQQYSRRWNLRIYKVPEKEGETAADCGKKCSKIFSEQMQINIKEADIEIAHRTVFPDVKNNYHIKMVFYNLTTVGKIGLGLFVVGIAFFIVGFAVPYWVTYDQSDGRIGLWQACTGSYCRGTVDSDYRGLDINGPPSWYRGTQAMACLALISLVADFLIRLLFLCGKPRKFLLISVVLDCVTGALAFLAAVIFGSKIENYIGISLNWGFAFDIIGGIFFAGSAACFLIQYIRSS